MKSFPCFFFLMSSRFRLENARSELLFTRERERTHVYSSTTSPKQSVDQLRVFFPCPVRKRDLFVKIFISLNKYSNMRYVDRDVEINKYISHNWE